MPKKNTPQIRLTGREFNSIKNNLIDFVKRYYPNITGDLSENSSLSLDIDLVSYVGDMLSFYLDYAVNETFQDSAVEFKNIVRNADHLGYEFDFFPSSVGPAALFIKVPTDPAGTGPDLDYLGILKRNTTAVSNNGSLFTLEEDVDFSSPDTQIVVAEVDSVSGVPTSYAVKHYGDFISGELISEVLTIGQFQKFLKVKLNSGNITEIVSVIDSFGNEYKEVNYLSQNIVFDSIPNSDSDKNLVPSILRKISVPRRFVVKRDGVDVFLQFGNGSDSELQENDILDPANVFIKKYGRKHITDNSFDPNKLLKNQNLGISPSNVSLTVTYRVNTVDNVNADSNTIVNFERKIFEFQSNNLNETKKRTVVSSLEITNEEPMVGDVSIPTGDELKIRSMNSFPTQNRAVTKDDYEAVVYRMPGKFGAIKRCSVLTDPDSFKRNLNMYVLSENIFGNFTTASEKLKNNLKTWISNFKMINDTIDIVNAKIINLGIEYSILSSMDYDKFDVLSASYEKLKTFFEKKPQIGEPFYITDIFEQLKKIPGVIDVIDVRVSNEKTFGGSYSNFLYDIEQNISLDGRRIFVPSDSVWEVKFPKIDIKGKII